MKIQLINRPLIIVLLLSFTMLFCVQTANAQLPNFVNKHVVKALTLKVEGKTINNSKSLQQNQLAFKQLAKLNAMHLYYKTIWEQNKSYNFLPSFLNRMLQLDAQIRKQINVYKDENLFYLVPRQYPQKFYNQNIDYHKSLSQIENEIDNWLNKLTPKEISGLSEVVRRVGSELSDEDSLGGKLCSIGYAQWSGSEPVTGFERAILRHLGKPTNDPDKEKHISKFFNENNSKLICNDSADVYIRENEHILKRSLALGEYNFLNHAANNSKYDLDWNFYEMVDGKKETILDYLDMIIGDEELASEYDVDELKSLITSLEEDGAKRGSELP